MSAMTEENIERNGSAEFQPIHPRLTLSPEPPPEPATYGSQSTPGDAVLFQYLCNGHIPDLGDTEHDDELEDDYEDVHEENFSNSDNAPSDGKEFILYAKDLKVQYPEPKSATSRLNHLESGSRLVALPQEVWFMIAQLLEPEDVFDLALCCRRLTFMSQTAHLLHKSRKTRPFSHEALRYPSFSNRALRIYAKRGANSRAGCPFLLACVGQGFDFIYANGAVCYTPSRTKLQFLDLDQTGTGVTSFDIPALVQNNPTPNKIHPYVYPLHYADGYISFIHSYKDLTSPYRHDLIVLDRYHHKVVTSRRLSTRRDAWVRNNQDWLYCGLIEGDDQWSLYEFHFHTKKWSDDSIPLAHMARGRMGVGVSNCFDVFDGFLYGASSECHWDDLAASADTFYYVFRIQLGQPTQSQVMDKPDCMRRRATGGVVDDRWSCLKLHRDEVSGRIYLYDSLQEKTDGQWKYIRHCSRMELVFREPPRNAFPGPSTKPEGWQPDWRHFHRDTHQGDRSNSYPGSPAFTTYIPDCHTFIDIDLRGSGGSTGSQIMQIRARPFSTRNIDARSLGKLDDGVFTWPREEHMTNNFVRRVLQPSRQLQGYADGRAVVFAARKDPTRARKEEIYLIGFDTSISIPSTQSSAQSA